MGFGKSLRKRTKKLRKTLRKTSGYDLYSKARKKAKKFIASSPEAQLALQGGATIFGGPAAGAAAAAALAQLNRPRSKDRIAAADFDPVNANEDAAAFGGEAPAAESKSNAKVVLVVVGVVGGILVLRRLKKGK